MPNLPNLNARYSTWLACFNVQVCNRKRFECFEEYLNGGKGGPRPTSRRVGQREEDVDERRVGTACGPSSSIFQTPTNRWSRWPRHARIDSAETVTNPLADRVPNPMATYPTKGKTWLISNNIQDTQFNTQFKETVENEQKTMMKLQKWFIKKE